MNKKGIVIVGYSGHGLVVADAALAMGLDLKYYCEKNERTINPFDLKYAGFEGDEAYNWSAEYDYILGIGDNRIRRKTGELITANNRNCLNVIHPSSTVSRLSRMGIGNFISSGVHLNALATIGNYCIMNTGAVVEHECRLGDAVHIAPGAVLAGNVSIGSGSFVGANSVIKEGVTIGDNVIIGAGTVVLKNIENNNKIVGNPGRVI
ncbi:acetyltransferase [Antarcticibacterium sp. 1MA-6-2]|uniref:acetyltransferase n=1 Tax=Antarcticibacterium sp. 1MA-6-2 TaxID=2908210 RepID=UPI001F39C21E|nr:acetyltransferase [Antarcticibacterium sp. 1MA-6-2]UJH91299.1 acetyltransferase [Antarcticibacterium sp. 1MA-6-2]